jgi:hypothetical protein
MRIAKHYSKACNEQLSSSLFTRLTTSYSWQQAEEFINQMTANFFMLACC